MHQHLQKQRRLIIFGLTEYQVRNKGTIYRHWMIVFLAFSFIARERLTGGLRARWSSRPLKTFGETWPVFSHAAEFRLLNWLKDNIYVFVEHRLKHGFKCEPQSIESLSRAHPTKIGLIRSSYSLIAPKKNNSPAMHKVFVKVPLLSSLFSW